MLTMDLAVITHKPEGIQRVAKMVLPPMEGVRYVVSWQNHQGAPIPAELNRPDVEIHRFEHAGQVWNRNNAFLHCKADIVVFSDDDLIYKSEELLNLRSFYELNHDVDVVAFQSEHIGSDCSYPSGAIKLSSKYPRGYYASGFELSFRRKRVGNLKCHPLFGLGSPKLHGGEDELLLYAAIKRGLNCWFAPITVCEHNHPSTGTKAKLTNENLRAMGAVLALQNPRTALLRVPLKAWRISRKGQASILRSLAYVTSGAIHAPFIFYRTRKYFW